MNQSIVIAGVVVFLFLVYVTSKGQLPAYLKILGISQSATTSTGGVNGPLNLDVKITSISPITPLQGITV